MQTMLALVDGETRILDLPAPDAPLMPDILWGRFDELFTAAYWCGQAWQAALLGRYRHLRLGRSLVEETAACLLGGYGMKAELGLAAFRRLRDRSILAGPAPAEAIEKHLAEPFAIDGKLLRYRFPRQKAVYLSACLHRLDGFDEVQLDDLGLRRALMDLPGIGPKTASWIVRNHRHSDHVAVLDVHILRAGQILGLFGRRETPQRDYLSLEARFIAFAAAVSAPASLLDAIMWQHMRLLQHA